MIQAKEILAPTTDSSSTSDPFNVDGHSRVVYIAPSTGSTLTEDDAFELRRVVSLDSNGNPDQTVKMYDKSGAILLGASLPQFEILIRGTYVVEKILATTEAVGVYQTYGNEEGV